MADEPVDIIKDAPELPARNNNSSRHLVAITTKVSNSGPLPPAQELARYDAVVPGAADRIIKMAEKQMEHRHAMEQKIVEGSIASVAQGRTAALIVSAMFIAGSCYLGYLGHPTYAISGMGGSLAALAGIYIWGNKTRQQEREHKKEIQTKADNSDEDDG